MKKRQFLKGMAATAAGILVPGHVLSGQYEFHQRVSGLRAGSPASPGPTMQDATPQERTGVMSTGVPLAEDGGVVWYGEVPSSGFITGNQLAANIDLTTGTSQYSDAGWLHVGLDGTELLIAKRPLRHSLSWNQINAVNAVYGNRVVTIGGVDYKVRLPKGANSDPAVVVSGFDIPSSHESEWNRILYRLTENVYLQAGNTKSSEEPFVHLANYSEENLILEHRVPGGLGACSLCQEGTSTHRVVRGYMGVSHLGMNSTTGTFNYNGWRPVLEKVS